MMKKIYFKKMVVALMIAGTCFSGTGFMTPAPAARAMEMETVKTKEADAVEDIYDELPTEVTKEDDRYEIKGPGIIGSVIDETADAGEKTRSIVKKAKAETQSNEYQDDAADYISKTMNSQMKNCVYGGTGTKAKTENLFNSAEIYSLNGSKSVFTFTLAKSRLGGMPSASMLLGYVGDAISKYPNLCTLQTALRINEDRNNIYLYVFSTHRVEEQKEAIEGYKSFLAEIEDIPKKSAEMSDIQTLLYLHDRVAQSAQYAYNEVNPKSGDYYGYNRKNYSIFTPIAIVETGRIVCQSYAAVMNQLMRDLGFTSYYVTSDDHAWNAVKLGGKWYYLDVTWDEGGANDPLSIVEHEYFLVKGASFEGHHALDAYYRVKLKGITGKFGDEFDNFFPKEQHIPNAFSYLNGKWYFANGGYVYECTGSELRKVVRKDIPTDEYRCAAVMQGNLYFTGSDGMYKFDDAMEKYSKTKEYNITQMFVRDGMLYIYTEIGWRTISRKNAEKPQYEEADDNTDENSTPAKGDSQGETPATDSGNGDDGAKDNTGNTPSGDRDGGNGQTQTENLSAPLFAAVNKSKKSIYVKLADTNYISGNTFEIQCSTKKGFSKGVQTKITTSKSAVLKGLKKGKTYYVRVRVMKKSGTGTLCSSWAKTEKVKISR